MTELVDGVPADLFLNLDKWLSAEHRVINLLLEQATRRLGGTSPGLEEIEAAHRPANEWASGFVNNLRVARKSPGGLEVSTEIAALTEHAEETAEQLLTERAALP
jgi:hypothetical protein